MELSEDVPAFCVAAEAVKFAGLGVDGKRRRLVFMEWAPEAQLRAVFARFLHGPLHQVMYLAAAGKYLRLIRRPS